MASEDDGERFQLTVWRGDDTTHSADMDDIFPECCIYRQRGLVVQHVNNLMRAARAHGAGIFNWTPDLSQLPGQTDMSLRGHTLLKGYYVTGYALTINDLPVPDEPAHVYAVTRFDTS